MKKSVKKKAAKSADVVAEAHVMRLYKAVANYVKKAGGNVVVAGGIQIEQWPGDGQHKFVVGIKCAGTKPTFATTDK